MSADHRKPFVAFVLLAIAAAVLVCVQRADALAGHLFEVTGERQLVHGTVPADASPSTANGSSEAVGLTFDVLASGAAQTSLAPGSAGFFADGRTPDFIPAVSRDADRRALGRAGRQSGRSGGQTRRGHEGRHPAPASAAGEAAKPFRGAEEHRATARGNARRGADKAERAHAKGEHTDEKRAPR